jgi:ZIP family zinc transporter
METANLLIAFGLTIFAGLSTGIGSAIAFTAKRTDYRFLAISTGFSAGVMLYVSFVDLFYQGSELLTAAYGQYWGHWVNVASFFGGMLLIGVIDNLVPSAENPHEIHHECETAPLHDPLADPPDFEVVALARGRASQDLHYHGINRRVLMRTGLFTAFAIAIHNLPEGLVTFFSSLQNPGLGVAIAFAVALHNIPEGISVSVPIFYATGDRKKAFAYSLLSGLAEPIGAGVAYILLRFLLGGEFDQIPPNLTGILFGGVAGIMVYISLDELLPTSRAYGRGHDSILGLMGGMLVMALSLLLMQ